MINRTTFMQPFARMIESTYADPYEVAKKMFGVETFIKCANLDRVDVVSQLYTETTSEDVAHDKKNIESPDSVTEIKPIQS